MNQKRMPAGVPTGGQFASSTREEPGVTLGSAEARTQDDVVATVIGDLEDGESWSPEVGLEVRVSRRLVRDSNNVVVPGAFRGFYSVTDAATGTRDEFFFDSTAASMPEADAVGRAIVRMNGARPGLDPLYTPATGGGPEQPWNATDADDRYPGRYVAHTASRGGFHLRVDPGDYNSYEADGFAWRAEMGSWSFSGVATSRDEAAREACEAADYVLSGEAEADYHGDEYQHETG